MTDIQKIKNSIMMEDLLSLLGFENVGKIKNRVKCIFHESNSIRNFSYNDDLFYCFNCGVKGDKVKLVMLTKKYSFGEAIKFLANITGIEFCVNDRKRVYKNQEDCKFPVVFCEMLAKKTMREYYNLNEIDQEIKEYSGILFSLRNDNVPELYAIVEKILDDLDSEENWLLYQRNQI